MRALFLVQQFWPYVGGLEVWASRLLPALVERGHEISVVTGHAALRLPDRDRYKGIDILRLPLRAGKPSPRHLRKPSQKTDRAACALRVRAARRGIEPRTFRFRGGRSTN